VSRSRAALFALLAFALVGVGGPLLAAGTVCSGEGGADDCELGCALCLCCSHVPRPALTDVGSIAAEGGSDGLGPWCGPAAPMPLPRDILHVPRAALSR